MPGLAWILPKRYLSTFAGSDKENMASATVSWTLAGDHVVMILRIPKIGPRVRRLDMKLHISAASRGSSTL